MSKTDVFEDRASNPFDLEVPILLEDSVVRATLENRRTTSLLAQEQYPVHWKTSMEATR